MIPDLYEGDIYFAPQPITGVLTIPDGHGGRQNFDIPQYSVFTLVKHDTKHGMKRWWVVTFNGFTPWTSIQTLVDRGHLELLRSGRDH